MPVEDNAKDFFDVELLVRKDRLVALDLFLEFARQVLRLFGVRHFDHGLVFVICARKGRLVKMRSTVPEETKRQIQEMKMREQQLLLLYAFSMRYVKICLLYTSDAADE